jgi:hypothetical protein
MASMHGVLRQQDGSNREVAAAFVVAFLIHLFLFLTIAYFIVNPLHPPKELPAEQEQDSLQLTILPPVAAPPPRPTYVSTTPQKNPDIQPKKDSPFESDNNSVAASESTPTGPIPLPSQDGREQSALELQNRQNRLGKAEQPAAQSSSSETQEAHADPTPRTDAKLAPLDKPKPKTPDTAKPKSATTAKPPADSGYQPETRVTRIRGNINNRGRAALEANATPLGRYKKQVSDAIGSRWYYYVNSQMGLLNIGTADIRFTVQPNGKVKGPQVLSNTSNESFASICISAILQAELPEIPPEVAKLLENGRLEIDYSFSILGN